MGKMSREKGKRGERELASKLREFGYNARRGQQYCGANGDADVVGLPGMHIEVKRTERLHLYDALDQSKRDAKDYEKITVNGLQSFPLTDLWKSTESGRQGGNEGQRSVLPELLRFHKKYSGRRSAQSVYSDNGIRHE